MQLTKEYNQMTKQYQPQVLFAEPTPDQQEGFYDIKDFESQVLDFNLISGQYYQSTRAAMEQQFRLIAEETQEIRAELDENNIVGVLDGCIDTLYVTLGMLHKLEYLGCDVQGAMRQVAEDNLDKFPLDEQTADETVLLLTNQGNTVKKEYNHLHERWVVKDNHNKVKKPVGFKPTDLSKYVPKELKNKGFKL